MGSMVVPPKRNAYILITRTCDCGLLLQKGFLFFFFSSRYNYIKDLEIRSQLSGWALNLIPFKRQKTGQRHGHKGKREAETGVTQPEVCEHLDLPEARRGKDSPLETLEAVQPHWRIIQMCDLVNCDRINTYLSHQIQVCSFLFVCLFSISLGISISWQDRNRR